MDFNGFYGFLRNIWFSIDSFISHDNVDFNAFNEFQKIILIANDPMDCNGF